MSNSIIDVAHTGGLGRGQESVQDTLETLLWVIFKVGQKTSRTAKQRLLMPSLRVFFSPFVSGVKLASRLEIDAGRRRSKSIRIKRVRNYF